jgi:hypothetical protein
LVDLILNDRTTSVHHGCGTAALKAASTEVLTLRRSWFRPRPVGTIDFSIMLFKFGYKLAFAFRVGFEYKLAFAGNRYAGTIDGPAGL